MKAPENQPKGPSRAGSDDVRAEAVLFGRSPFGVRNSLKVRALRLVLRARHRERDSDRSAASGGWIVGSSARRDARVWLRLGIRSFPILSF